MLFPNSSSSSSTNNNAALHPIDMKASWKIKIAAA